MPRLGDSLQHLSTDSRCRHFFNLSVKIPLKCIIVSMDYVECVAKLRYTFETCHILWKKTVPFIMTDNYYQIFICHNTENKWIIVSQTGFIHNVIVVQHKKYVEVCHAIVRMVQLLAKKIPIFKVKVILFCPNYLALDIIYRENILETQYHHQGP